MYLKSLVLKGFKSFADRSVLTFEPGLTVVVGPNGSGKSNISDSILWVLGEQSARQLRGHSMEDVIFSGSSAHKPVSMAEVDLVLDNSDHMVPLEFDEIAISRRMYRSGESEYLINGAPSLLRDILDILHDSGIGREAHSVISQGTLSQVLDARDIDRRALIEEVAGILKHKKRKERAARKLGSMEAALDRVHDVAKEMDRQLKPLARQAKRAEQHGVLSAELGELELALATDDLRSLQKSWEAREKEEKEASAAIELARLRYGECEHELEKYQRALQEKGLFVGNLAEQRSRCQSIMERLDGNMLLLEEKGNNMVARTSDLRSTIHQSRSQLERDIREHEALSREFGDAKVRLGVLRGSLAEHEQQSQELREQRRASDEEHARLSADLRKHNRTIDDCKAEIERYRTAAQGLDAEDALLASRLDQLEETRRNTDAEQGLKRVKLQELEQRLERESREESLSRDRVADCTRALEAAQSDLRSRRDRRDALRAELAGLLEVDRAVESSTPARNWVNEHLDELSDVSMQVSRLFRVPRRYQMLIERLLGSDLFGLLVKDSADAVGISAQLAEVTGGAGEMSLLPLDVARGAGSGEGGPGIHLLDEIGYPERFDTAARALLGDVWVVDDLEQAFEAVAAHEGRRYITSDGSIVWPNGKVSLGVRADDAEGLLGRKERLAVLEQAIQEVEKGLPDHEAAAREAEAELRKAEDATLASSQRKAATSGELASLRAEVARLDQSLTALAAERQGILTKREEIARDRSRNAPLVEELVERMRRLGVEVEELEERIAAGSDARTARIDASNALRRQISELKVDIATLETRSAYLEQRLAGLAGDIASHRKAIEVSHETQTSLDILSHRVEPLYRTLRRLYEGISRWSVKLRDQAALEQSDSVELSNTIEEARARVHEAKVQLDGKVEDLSRIRVEKGRLEAQVEVACQTIVEGCGTSVESALALPPLADREDAEARMAAIRAKIGKMGPVNHVAAEEYAALKARREYLQVQVDDLEQARDSLSTIVTAIDAKMRARFLETFKEVDEAFQEIFASLFPGGKAHLELTEPDDPDASGIAVFAQPRGKRFLKMSLLSGGEKSLTALALLFAAYRTCSVPFYVLDEVDTALDDTNLRRLAKALDSMRHETQFIIITHARRTMEMADVLYGVSMQADGVSKVVSQKLERVGDAAVAEDSDDPEGLQRAIDREGDVAKAVAPARANR
ncbi:MAG: chromosome segregation protein SMC [Actinomycetota bacterium]|nr:chromosome segregation protein SMC [Actinomycetota bacterium]